MDDAKRYRLNAAECLLAGERCEPAYRDLTFAIAESWLSLARQEEAMDKLLAVWSKHSPWRQSCCLSSFPATRLAIGLLRRERGKQFPPKARG
jgi:hypothetical protein